jgi:hypothetical protein
VCGVTSDSCRFAPFALDTFAYSANGDNAPPVQQVDHGHPVLAFYSYGQASALWMDLRSSPLVPGSTFIHDDTVYDYRRRLTRYGPGDIERVLTTSETPGWPVALGVPVPYVATGRAYLDVDFMATVGLHSHSVHAFYGLGAGPRAMTILSSPREPPQ